MTSVQISPLFPDFEHDCLILGPAGSGKSSLLSALNRACDGRIRDGYGLSLVPGESLTGLIADAARFLGGVASDLRPTQEPATHDFQLRIHDSTDPRTIQMIVQDLPGADLFDAPTVAPEMRSRLQRARTASCLVLCVNSMAPDRSLWESRLPGILDGLLMGSGRLVQRLSRIGQREMPPLLSPERQLPFRKVLVLLNQIDLLCSAAIESLAARRTSQSQPLPPALERMLSDSSQLASHLEPAQTLRERLGSQVLTQLRSACCPGTLFAVGLTSAWGFEPQREKRPRSRSSRLDRWAPFGVREALLFLATGEMRRPVEALPEDEESVYSPVPIFASQA